MSSYHHRLEHLERWGREPSRLRVRRHKRPGNGYVPIGLVISVNALPGVRASRSQPRVALSVPSCRGPLSPATRAERSAMQPRASAGLQQDLAPAGPASKRTHVVTAPPHSRSCGVMSLPCFSSLKRSIMSAHASQVSGLCSFAADFQQVEAARIPALLQGTVRLSSENCCVCLGHSLPSPSLLHSALADRWQDEAGRGTQGF